MSAGSWSAFVGSVDEENRSLAELGAAALSLTSALVFGSAAEIEVAQRRVENERLRHAQAHLRRTTMMRGAFGERTLREVCAHAPPALRSELSAGLREMTTRGIALQITVRNNKALIAAGLQRIAATIAVLQKHMAESSGTYKRRGTVAPPNGSLIMSRRA